MDALYTGITHLSDLTIIQILSQSAPDVTHCTMGLGQYAGLRDARPGPSSSGACSASLHGLLQPGALALLPGIICAAVLSLLFIPSDKQYSTCIQLVRNHP